MTIEQHFMGLSDRTRLRMLNLLLKGEMCGCDVQFVLELSQSNVSRHLNYLKRAALVADRRDGYRVFYRIAEDDSRTFPLLLEYLRKVFAADNEFDRDLKRLKYALRDGACSRSEQPGSPRSARRSSGRRSSVRA